MDPAEYARHDGLALAELVARKQVSASELLEAAIQRADRLDPQLGAIVHRMDERARARAREIDAGDAAGPLAGVPMLLKDLLGDVQGEPSTSGSRFLAEHRALWTSELTHRFERAGLVAFGRTNTPEYGLVPTTESRLHGPARNPWNLDHSTGGSSGGSAAATAAGIVPIAHANDGGGSIRIPAAACGLVGLKPTRGRNTLAPLGDELGGLVCEHVVTRSVRDSAAVLDATHGPHPGDPYYAAPPERPYLEQVKREPGALRVAFWTRSFEGRPLDPACVEAVERTARLCEQLGHRVEEANLPIDQASLTQHFMALWAAGAAAVVEAHALLLARQPREDELEPLTWGLVRAGREVSAVQYQLALAALQGASRGIAGFFEHHDVWLSPTLGAPPIKLGTIDVGQSDPIQAFAPIIDYVPHTATFNVTGQPAISLPLEQTPDGLPIGLHFAGRYGEEGLLLCLAAQLEQARPWAERRPPVW